MQAPLALIFSLAMFLGVGSGVRLETRDTYEAEPAAPTTRQIKWPKRTIEVHFSSSLLNPGANIKPGTDVVGAARRALSRWSSMSNINFVVNWSSVSSVSPASAGDGINLITVADTFENQAFNSDATTGRTRVFFDPETGTIAEADISINPRPRSDQGADLQFSSDGTPGTYDLEATFTHEIGHLLGLDHSSVLASTMQSRQGFNGTFGLPALTERTLSEDDRHRIRTLYGSKHRLGRIEGRLIDNRLPNLFTPLESVNVWVENVATGRVVTSAVTGTDGSYRLDGLAPGQYRLLAGPRSEIDSAVPQLRSFEISSQVAVKSDLSTTINYNLVPPHSSLPSLNPRMIGLNSELSTVPLPVEAGRKIKVYLGGEGIDQVPGASISVNSPYFSVDPASLTREQLGTSFPVVSVELSVAPNAPFGDYTIKLQSTSGETAFVPGALTIDPGVASAVSNPLDDYRFFISQHYADITGKEIDRSALEKLSSQFAACGTRAECLRARRLEVSTSLLTQELLPKTGTFLSSLYNVALGRRPRIAEFENDRALLGNSSEPETPQLAIALMLVQRSEFQKKFAASLKGEGFVDQVLETVSQKMNLDLKENRDQLVAMFDGSDASRASILLKVASQPAVIDAQYNQGFVMAQYFSYLRRDPDEAGFNFWVNSLKSKPLRDPEAARSMVCAFVTSIEYQNRFGMLATHTSAECGN